ncbi:MAG: hypothetical protein VX791_08140 [Pseudomonadota bacterium]|uniref:hypothetical protein n=1 Tax=Pseudooceanicola nitratireducens TaxID=517719 RepID=UPI002EA55DAB|nr:hypothetical protein [Pseudomonadota bacterium]
MTDHQPKRREDEAEFSEEQSSLLKITMAPTLWAAHFVVCYALVAVTCAKGWDFPTVRAGLLVFSCLVVGGISLIGWRAWRQWNVSETGDFINRRGRAEDRHHFLGHAAFLLSVISVIGAIFVTLPLVFIGGCQ